MKKDIVSTTLRVPIELLITLKHKAVDNHRSVNAELLYRLQESVRKEDERNATA